MTDRVRCIECTHVTSQNVSPANRRAGLCLCKLQPQPAGTHFTLEYERKCHLFNADSSEVVAARRAWLRGVANLLRASLNLPSLPGPD